MIDFLKKIQYTERDSSTKSILMQLAQSKLNYLSFLKLLLLYEEYATQINAKKL